MIKFFRGIRQRLLSENSFSKYLLYAIGEIFLVVLGILIALQINNFNEESKAAVFELELLHSFRSGLQKDLSDIDVNIGFHKRGLKAIDTLMMYLQTENRENPDTIALLFSKAMLQTFFQHSTSAFETLKSQGITTIQNEALRDRTISVYDSQYNFFAQNEDIHVKEIQRGLTEIFPMRFEDSYSYNLDSPNLDGRLQPLDFEALNKDQEFLYYFKSLRNRTEIFIDFNYAKLRNSVTRLLLEVEAAIDQKI